jgi:hypothetical protein
MYTRVQIKERFFLPRSATVCQIRLLSPLRKASFAVPLTRHRSALELSGWRRSVNSASGW